MHLVFQSFYYVHSIFSDSILIHMPTSIKSTTIIKSHGAWGNNIGMMDVIKCLTDIVIV